MLISKHESLHLLKSCVFFHENHPRVYKIICLIVEICICFRLRVRVGHLILLRIQIQKQYAIVGMEMDFSNMNCLTLILAKWKIIIDEQGKWRPKYQVSSENCYYVGADFSLHLVHQGKRKKRNRKCRRKKDEHGNEPKNRGIMFTSCQR